MTHPEFQAQFREVLSVQNLTQKNAARRLGVAMNTIESWLASSGSKQSRVPDKFQQIGILSLLAARPKKAEVDWSRVDWTRGTAALAKQLGMSQANVSYARRRFAPATKLAKHAGKRKNIAWETVDWSLTTCDLAEKLGCSYHAVWAQRRQRAPHTLKHPL